MEMISRGRPHSAESSPPCCGGAGLRWLWVARTVWWWVSTFLFLFLVSSFSSSYWLQYILALSTSYALWRSCPFWIVIPHLRARLMPPLARIGVTCVTRSQDAISKTFRTLSTFFTKVGYNSEHNISLYEKLYPLLTDLKHSSKQQ
jgi:hypothetical protein